MILYRIIASQDSALRQLWEEWWILSCISEWKMYFWKEEKRTVRKSRTVELWDDFDSFWKLYPKKQKKKETWVVWFRMKENERLLAIEWLKRYLSYWKKTNYDLKYVPMPCYWLKDERYNDKLDDFITVTRTTQEEQINREMEEDRKNREEKERIDREIWKLKQDEVKWREIYNKARSELTENQRNLPPQIVESLILTRVKMSLTK